MVGARKSIIGAGTLAILIAAATAFAAEGLDKSAMLSQGEWARMIVDRLGHTSALPATASADEAAALLGTRAVSVARHGKAAKVASADGAQKPWRYDVDLPRTGTYLLTVANTAPGFAGLDKQPGKLLAAGGPDGLSDVGLFPLAGGRHVVNVTGAQATAPDVTLVAGC